MSQIHMETLRDSNSNDQPKIGDTVTVHYIGKLENGNVFDSSHKRGRPFQFKIGVGQVIRGWDEGVMNMKLGQSCRLFIPPHLGYGVQGAGNVIPPNSSLTFDVDLLGIN